jgi:hypothetical protein
MELLVLGGGVVRGAARGQTHTPGTRWWLVPQGGEWQGVGGRAEGGVSGEGGVHDRGAPTCRWMDRPGQRLTQVPGGAYMQASHQ